ncbi:UDP-N-acetylmuramate--L-alanine ligase [Spirosoma panaciterrae]|uniref:UDP-N-acetylmuramate--L-alanine ligase n=1 Tax=Spirosoma panaciterrae TaxID=496058 RepID=UPI0003A22F2F|nr:Mur ligase domain-containing protein [Spirosoma panaciterrae]
MPQSIHFISIGGSAMHNLALALHQQGYTVTGSDETIYEPSRTRLEKQNLLPAQTGWFPQKIHSGLDAVIVGMHARRDNPELTKALELGLPIYSYPEFIYQLSRQKQRVVIAGSHGKTTIVAMILHVLKHYNREFDFWIGDPIQEFDTTVRLSLTAPLIIIEGDEYASSPIDSRPKFLAFQPHIALISGIAWDHINLYPTWDEYVDQFESLAEAMPKAGILIFDESDDMLDVIGQKERDDITKIPYLPHPSEIVNGDTFLLTKQGKRVPTKLFGQHNMKNISGAMTICDRIGLTEEMFYEAIPSFNGVSKRLEKIAESTDRIVFRDFAHSPAKVEATTEAVKQQYPKKKLLAVVELQSIDNANKSFLDKYKETTDAADQVAIFIHPISTDSSDPLTTSDIQKAFDNPSLQVFTDSAALQDYLLHERDTSHIFLFMSSETFGGLDLTNLAQKLI